MNKENLIAAGFHSHEGIRHHEEYLKAKKVPPQKVENIAELGFVDRFNRMSERVTPLLKPQGVYDRDWYITPEVPMNGVVEDQEFTVYLSIQVQFPGSGSENMGVYIRTPGRQAQGMSQMHTSRSFCEHWEKSERKDEALTELDHVEEIVDVYLRTLADLTPKQLHELGFPSEYVPESIQLSLID